MVLCSLYPPDYFGSVTCRLYTLLVLEAKLTPLLRAELSCLTEGGGANIDEGTRD